MELNEGEPPPEWISEQPELFIWLEPIMRAFLDLHTRRSFGMGGANPIAISDINAYFQMFDIVTLEEKRYYLRMIGLLDNLYLRLEAERQQREAKSKK